MIGEQMKYNTIPQKLRTIISTDEYYRKCCITGAMNGIEMHHSLIIAGKRIQEIEFIMPVHYLRHNRNSNRANVHNDKMLYEYVQYLSFVRIDSFDRMMDLEDKYPRFSFLQRHTQLSDHYKFFNVEQYLREVDNAL